MKQNRWVWIGLVTVVAAAALVALVLANHYHARQNAGRLPGVQVPPEEIPAGENLALPTAEPYDAAAAGLSPTADSPTFSEAEDTAFEEYPDGFGFEETSGPDAHGESTWMADVTIGEVRLQATGYGQTAFQAVLAADPVRSDGLLTPGERRALQTLLESYGVCEQGFDIFEAALDDARGALAVEGSCRGGTMATSGS